MRSQQEQLIAGIDLGSTAIRMALGQILVDGDREGLHLLGTIEVASEGIHKGVITSIEDAVSATSACLEKMERAVGSPIEHAWVGVGGSHITCDSSRGVVAISRPNGEISDEDVERAIEAARAVATPLNYEILHVIPRCFTVDGGNPVKDPVSMSGVRLEVDTHIVQGASGHIKNLTKTIYRTGLDIDDLILSILSASETVTSDRARDMGVAVVDIGAATTSLVVIEDGDIIHSAFIPLGSEHITADIAIGLKTSIETAERIKILEGTAIVKGLHKRDMIDTGELGIDEEPISKKYLAQIIEARVEEILEKIDIEFKSIGRDGMLPAGVVFVGGGAKLQGLIDCAKRKLRLPAALGYPLGITSVTDKINDVAFASAIGLTKWGADVYVSRPQGRFRQLVSGVRATEKAVDSVRKWMKSLLP